MNEQINKNFLDNFYKAEKLYKEKKLLESLEIYNILLMGGGLLQLVCRGQQDIYLCENPDISFFKYAYKKHTRFAIENIKLEFDKLPTIEPEIIDAEYNCKIDRIGDLLKNLYFCCTLPAIYSSSNLAFKWVKNIGHILIKKTTIKIDGIVIDTLTSDWLNIWNELTIDTEGYNQMIGNIDSLTNPSLTSKKKIILKIINLYIIIIQIHLLLIEYLLLIVMI